MKFTLIRSSDLLPKHFAEHPVWADYSEPSDIDEIVKWGLPRDEITRRINECPHGDAEYYFPVLCTDQLPEFRFLHIHAQFRAADGTAFAGYVIGSNPYCVAVFHENEIFSFNNNLKDLADQQVARLRLETGLPFDPFFPLRYFTPFRDEDRLVDGSFSFEDNP